LILAFGITWGRGGIALVASVWRPEFRFDPSNPLVYLAAFGPSAAGLLLTRQVDGWRGVGRLLRRLVPNPRHAGWYLVVLLGAPIVTIVVARTGFSYVPTTEIRHPLGLAVVLGITLVEDPGPLGEELGWRGFALPNLLRQHAPLSAALLLGVAWALWHLPTFFIPTLSQSRLSFPVFVVNSCALSVIMTSLYLKTNGDMLLMILVHLMANFCGGVLAIPFTAEVVAEVLVAATIVVLGGLPIIATVAPARVTDAAS
jgi:membrane protease YdiL (CAAX protease family)